MSVPARILVLSAMLFAATCGQKGPLHLPDENSFAGGTATLIPTTVRTATE